MSQAVAVLDVTFKAGADLSTSQYAAVKLGTGANEVVLAGANEESIGVLQNKPTSGQAAQVRMHGTSKMKASGAISKGAAVAAAASGKIAAAGDGHTHTENTAGTYTQNATTSAPGAASIAYIIGRALEAAAADGDLIEVFISPQRW